MGQKDISLITYFEDQRRYADLINGFVFKGKQIVSNRMYRRWIPGRRERLENCSGA